MKPLEAMRQAMRRHSVLTGASDPMLQAMVDALADNVTEKMCWRFIEQLPFGHKEIIERAGGIGPYKAALTAAIKGAN